MKSETQLEKFTVKEIIENHEITAEKILNALDDVIEVSGDVSDLKKKLEVMISQNKEMTAKEDEQIEQRERYLDDPQVEELAAAIRAQIKSHQGFAGDLLKAYIKKCEDEKKPMWK